jgi:hypothetical protein
LVGKKSISQVESKDQDFNTKFHAMVGLFFFDIGELEKMLETFQSSSTHIEWIGEWG